MGRALQRAVSEIVLNDLDDPSIGFVTITGADISPDLRNATIYFSVLGDPEQVAESSKVLARARKFINVQLGAHMQMRYTPLVHFRLDETAERAQRIERVLRDIEQAEPTDTQPTDTEPEQPAPESG